MISSEQPTTAATTATATTTALKPTTVEVKSKESVASATTTTMAASTITVTGSELSSSNAVDQTTRSLPSASAPRQIKLLVREQLFMIDAQLLCEWSPIFAKTLACDQYRTRESNDNGVQICEIVDETSNDIAKFLDACNNCDTINDTNFAILVSLANKYEVNTLTTACENFILDKCKLNELKVDQVVTLLIAANEYHLNKQVITKLIARIASEARDVLTGLKLSRVLPSHLHTAIINFNLNLAHLKELETMNGHLFKMNRFVTLYRRMACNSCKKIVDAAYCEGCKKVLCKTHWAENKCSSDYGINMINELRHSLSDFDWQ